MAMFASLRVLSRRAVQAARVPLARAFAVEASAAQPQVPTPPSGGGGGGGMWGLLIGGVAAAGGLYYAKENGYLDGMLGSSDGSSKEEHRFQALFEAGASWGQGKAASAKPDYDAVRKAVSDLIASEKAEEYDDGSYGPILVRLAWHCSGTYDKASNSGGSNGATMRFPAEKGIDANKGLNIAMDLLEPIKEQFPWISYSDLWTLAGATAIEDMGGPHIPWRPGRTDRPDGGNCPPDGRLPDGSKGAPHIRDIFYRMGFNDQEIVALSGAHALGRCHSNRSGFEGPWTHSPITFSNQYFVLLLDEKWNKKKWKGPMQYEDGSSKSLMMLPTDMALIWDKAFKPFVQEYAKDEDKFFKDFAAAFSKLLELGVPFPEGAAQAA